ncbi:kinase-like protein [Laetiporus sulphureus 93-53]|uniref:Kinase-like protein n=1 Tax=Laetiporus sulphureus 93-53 TaxID=1314785 RepID=A0A165HAE6_9APHY|nr:kinase-like protein [Laetiporus sulphureus 93-53]KZT11463.1 kinase-like protein [Laetiporus sulphureus 93-53]
MSPAGQLVRVAVGAAGLAGDLGVPYIGAVAGTIEGIQNCCEKVSVHKKDSQTLSRKIMTLIEVLRANSDNAEAEELRAVADEMTLTLESIHNRVSKWAQYNRVEAFCRDGEIGDGLRKCNAEIDSLITKFQVTTAFSVSNLQIKLMEIVKMNHEELKEFRTSHKEEMRQFTMHFLKSKQQLEEAAALQREGRPVAERMMEQGQLLLQESGPSVGSNQSRAHSLTNVEYTACQQGLVTLQRLADILPTLKDLSGQVTKVGDLPVNKGGHTQVWEGLLFGDIAVALKALQGVEATPGAKARFENEIVTWSKLKHPNILPLYGIVSDLGPFLHTVSPWRRQGDVRDYTRANPEANKSRLLHGAAKGLAYLDAQGIIHGNVRCANMLVTDEGDACICDFGMSQVIGEITQTPFSATATRTGSTRWLAPELVFDTKMLGPNDKCDVWSFGMSMLECYGSRDPFAEHKRDAHVIRALDAKTHPVRPQNLPEPSDALWKIMTNCWAWEPHDRLTMREVVSQMQEIMPQLH